MQLNLFDQPVQTERKKKEVVLNRYERNNKEFIELARKKARWFCHTNKGFMKYGTPNTVTSDDVRNILGITPGNKWDKRNNIMGQIFRKGFVWIEEWYTSKMPNSHGNDLKIWVMKKDINEL